ncbi:MAG TPA: hypothetical protein VD860_17000 [Azospirillum sp.]|nr:hypothetical protein [Azospirillum sp.]
MTVRTAAGSKIYIGPANETADVEGEFSALSYTLVGEVEDLGDIGDTAGSTTFTSVGDRRVRKLKTTYDAGTFTLTVGFDGSDAGQDALVAAFSSDSDYAFKVTLNDGSEGSPSSPTILYFRAKVMSKPINIGNVENVVRRRFDIAINSEVIEVSAV